MISWYSNESLWPIALRVSVCLAAGSGLALWFGGSGTLWLVAVGVPLFLGALSLRRWHQARVAKSTAPK